MGGIDWSLSESWGELGREWWENNGKACACSSEQIKFAVLRHGGSSATAAARGAGYSGTGVAMRQAGYRTLRSTGVTNLLALATAADGLDDGAITDAEVDAKIAKLVRSADARVSIAAIEAREKQKARRAAEAGPEPERTPDEVLLDIIKAGGIAAATAILFSAGDIGWDLKATPLLAPHCRKDMAGLWARIRGELSGHEQAFDDSAMASCFRSRKSYRVSSGTLLRGGVVKRHSTERFA